MGPFHADAPVRESGAMIANGPEAQRGESMVVRGRVLSEDGTPLAGATVDIWQAADDGFYDVQPESDQPKGNLRGVFVADDDGGFWFRTIAPLNYPVPTDGPVGEFLKSTGRHPMRPAHIHFWIVAEGHEPLITHIFRNGDEFLDSDAVFGVKESLIVDFNLNESVDEAEEYGFDQPFYEVSYDFILRKSP
jgi:protocatechuate 3,4-dioxygenase beta subunit